MIHCRLACIGSLLVLEPDAQIFPVKGAMFFLMGKNESYWGGGCIPDKKTSEKIMQWPNPPPRCMPLGYVFYRQFSGLPVSTLAVFFDYIFRKESREKKSYQLLMCLMMFVSHNSLKDFLEIHVFSPVRK